MEGGSSVRTMKQFLILLTAIFIMEMVWAGHPAMAERRAPVHSGLQRPTEVKGAPDFLLKDLDGNATSLGNYQGKVVLVHFWATWCIPCKEELPTINALWERFRDRGLVIVAVAEDSKKAVEPFIREHGLKFPVVIDQYGKAFRSYGVRGLPTSYLVNRAGNIEGIAIGQRDWIAAEVTDLIEGLLRE